MRTIVLALKDWVQIVRDWKAALFLVVMPILFTLIFGFAFGGGGETDPRLPLGFVNRDQEGVLGAELRELLVESQIVRLVALGESTSATLAERVHADELAAALVVPDGFNQRALTDEAQDLTVIVNQESLEGRTALNGIETAVSRLQGAVEAAHISAANYQAEQEFESESARQAYLEEAISLAVAAWQAPPITVGLEKAGVEKAGLMAERDEAASGFEQASPGMMVQFAVYGLITSGMVLLTERQAGALERLMTTPIRPAQVIGGHVLAMFGVALLQQWMLVALGQWLFGVDYLRAPLAILIVTVALSLWVSSVGLLIGALSRTQGQVITGALVAMFFFSALGGAWFPLEVAGETFSTIGHAMPTAWAMDGLQNVVVRGLGLRSVLLPAGVLLAYAAAFFGLAVWRFRFE
jgi:ABC-2 type transport system permease protein